MTHAPITHPGTRRTYNAMTPAEQAFAQVHLSIAGTNLTRADTQRRAWIAEAQGRIEDGEGLPMDFEFMGDPETQEMLRQMAGEQIERRN